MKLKLTYPSAKMSILADQVVVSGSSFASNILVARTLGITGYGTFSAVLLIQLFLLSLQQSVSSGIYQVLLGRFSKRLQKIYTNGLFYLQLLVYGMLILIGAVVYALNIRNIQLYSAIILPAFTGIILFLFQDFLRKILITSHRERKALLIDIITNFLQLILLFVFAITGKLTIECCLWIMGLTFLPSIISGICWVKPGAPKSIAIWLTIKWHKQHSGWMFLSALLQWFAGNFFVLAAGWWLGLAALGALRLGQYIFGLLNVLIQAIENYALPRGVALQHSGSQFRQFLLRILTKTAIIVVPVLILLSVFAKQLLQFSGGAAYTSYAYVMYGLSVIYLLIITGLPVRIALRVGLLNKQYFIGYAWATAFSLLSSAWLIQQWQLAGVLAGLFITQLIVVSYWFIILNRKKIVSWKLSTSF